ncbi:mediator of RNA polymerase II transcription subunit 15-like [Pseudorasbora parva]|uniref:mediator of RNA polymerase II transcription subunit 15-like n=1 Tax=Pseudorasbora parva TaxID=51549 RepID=UPI00351EF8AB
MTSPHSGIPQCINLNEPERMSQSEQQLPSPHCDVQTSAPLPIQYPSEVTTDSARKSFKQKLLTNSPETLFADRFKTGEICNLIFFSDHPSAWHKAIISHYPSVKKEGICNGWKVKIREAQDPDSTVMTVNIYKNGTVMVQGNLTLFQADFRAIGDTVRHEKALLSERLSSDQNPQTSTSDPRPTSADITEKPSSTLLKSIPLLQEHFTKLEMEMVQLRETVLKQQPQSHTCAAHAELQQNTERLTQRLTALTQQTRTLQSEKESYQSELSALRLQLQDREQATLEMRQQLRDIQEEREQQSSELQALREQLRELILARGEETHRVQTLPSSPETHRVQTLPSSPEPQHRPVSAERPDPDSSQPSQPPLSDSSAQQHQPSSHSSPAPSSTEEPQIALLIDSNGKFIDIKKLFPRHKAVKFWCPTTDKALELLTESQLGRPSHIIIHTGTNDLRSQQDRVSDSLRAVVEKARKTFPNSKIILSTLLQRKDFHPNTILKINSSISRHCALLPNVHLAHHPDLDTDCLYDHVHLYKSLVHILAKRLKDVALNRTNQTNISRWSRTSPSPAKPMRHTPGNYIPAPSRAPANTPSRAPPRTPHRAPAPGLDPYRQRLPYSSPTAPAAEARPQQSPAQPSRPSYAQAVSGGVTRANTELHDIQHMLGIICSHLLTHSGQW